MPIEAEKDNDHGKRVWRGKSDTVSETREAYRKEPVRNLLPFACALYSIPNPQNLRELRGLRRQLINSMPMFFDETADDSFGSHWLARIDMATEYLASMVHDPALPKEERAHICERTLAACEEAIAKVENMGGAPIEHLHNYHLILLTFVSLQKTSDYTLRLLGWVARDAHLIHDRKQRVRVYAKLGVQLRARTSYGRPYLLRGLGWGIRACFVFPVPLFSWLKAVASLPLFDRLARMVIKWWR